MPRLEIIIIVSVGGNALITLGVKEILKKDNHEEKKDPYSKNKTDLWLRISDKEDLKCGVTLTWKVERMTSSSGMKR